jgi:hypothetical protein
MKARSGYLIAFSCNFFESIQVKEMSVSACSFGIEANAVFFRPKNSETTTFLVFLEKKYLVVNDVTLNCVFVTPFIYKQNVKFWV